jgi:transcriptional regulator with XRE-family HTH domain
MYTKKEIGRNIKLLRLTRNMTQGTFAKRLDVARTTVTELETGTHVTFKHILNICRICNVDLYSLTGENDYAIVEKNLSEIISPSKKKVKITYDGYVCINNNGRIELYSNNEITDKPICNLNEELEKLTSKKIRISIKEY